MYYIVNANEQVVAADQEFLDKLGLNNITQIYQKLDQGDISLTYKDDVLKLKSSSITEEYKTVKTPLHSLLGDLYIIEFKESIEIQSQEESSSIVDDTDDILKNLFDEDNTSLDLDVEESEAEDIVSIVDDTEVDSIEISDVEQEKNDIEIEDTQDSLLLDEDNFLLEDSEQTEESNTEEDNKIDNIDNDDEIFDLLLTSDDNAPLISLEHEDEKSEEAPIEKEEKSVEPIVLDIDNLSQIIGISVEDYKNFLDEYKETAVSLEQDIKDNDIEKRNSAIQTLQHLSDVLHIPKVNEVLDKLEKEFSDNLVQELYSLINNITVDKEEVQVVSESIIEDKSETFIKEPETIEEETKEESIEQEENVEVKQEENISARKHKIDLSNVKPIHFDFSMEQAANELSLPVDLIDEFVHDFIEQAHEETENMLTAYDEGDLDRVNKLGHLLKGTSSNLRITPLADTLYKIQFCESLDELEPLIKDYWGHFLAFEKHIKMRTN